MSNSSVLAELGSSDDPVENDLAAVLRHWQDAKSAKGGNRRLGREPNNINRYGAIEVISRRVLKEASGFEAVDPELSYEGIVLRYQNRFAPEVVTAAHNRIHKSAFDTQDVQFFIKTSLFELFGDVAITDDVFHWKGRSVVIPKLLKEHISAERFLKSGFIGFIWLHEQASEGRNGRGLSAIVRFGPMGTDRRSVVVEAERTEYQVGRDVLELHTSGDSFLAKINKHRHTRTWPITDAEVEELFTAIRTTGLRIANPDAANSDADDTIDSSTVEDEMSLRQVVSRRNQSVFRNALLDSRPHQCAVTGTAEEAVLEAAHIIPYASRISDRDRVENGLLLRSDIHKLFDAFLISIDPETRRVRVSDRLASDEYRSLGGTKVSDPLSRASLQYHFEKFSES